MNDPVVLAKLESIRRCIARIELGLERAPTRVEFERNLDVQDSVMLNLQRSVQLAVDAAARVSALSGLQQANTMKQSFLNLSEAGLLSKDVAEALARAVGFRNVAVHAYIELDMEQVYWAAQSGINDLRAFMREFLSLDDSLL